MSMIDEEASLGFVMEAAQRTYRIPLGWRILLSSSAVLVVLIVCMLAFVNFRAQSFVNDRISADLTQGSKRIDSTVNQQFDDLRLIARLVASIPVLNALLGTDLPTIKDFLRDQQQNLGPDLLIVFDRNGQVVARTDMDRAEQLPEAQVDWVKLALSGKGAVGMLRTRSAFYSCAAFPAAAGDIIFGAVLAGKKCDRAFADRLRGASNDEIIIVKENIVGSTLTKTKESMLAFQSGRAWAALLGERGKPRQLLIG